MGWGRSVKRYLPDKAVGGGVGGGASVGALESALPLGVLSLSTEGRRERTRLKSDCHPPAAPPPMAAESASSRTGLIFHLLALTGDFNLIGNPQKSSLFGLDAHRIISPPLPASPWLRNID